MTFTLLLLAFAVSGPTAYFLASRKKTNLATLSWEDLVARLEPVSIDGVAKIAIDYLHPVRGQLAIEPNEMWSLIGRAEGLRRMQASCCRVGWSALDVGRVCCLGVLARKRAEPDNRRRSPSDSVPLARIPTRYRRCDGQQLWQWLTSSWLVSSFLNGCAVFAHKHALALAHASGAASARGGFPTWNEVEGERERRSAQAQRGRLGCLLHLPGETPQQVWLPRGARSAGNACSAALRRGRGSA